MITRTLKYFSLIILFMHGYSMGTNPNTVIGIVTDESPATFSFPSNAAIFTNGQTMYVANFASSTISIVNLSTNLVTGTVTDVSETINNPYGISFTPNGQTAYIMNSSSNSISIVNTATNTVTGTVNTSAAALNGPYYMAINDAGTTGYVVNSNNGNVTLVDLTTNATTQNITLPSPAVDLTNILIAPNGTTAYISTYYNGVYKLDLGTNTFTAVTNGTFNYPYALAITPDGSTLYASNFYGNTVSVIDTATNTQTAIVTDLSPATFNEPYGMAMSPDGTTLYVANEGASVSIVDVASNTVTGEVTDLSPATINGPVTIVLTPNGQYGYIVNAGNSSVSIVFISPGLLPPSNFTGCTSQDVFLLQEDLVNILNWNSPSGATGVASYNIYSNTGLTQLVANVPASGPLQYIDHNRLATGTYSYYIVSVDSQSGVSSPVALTVNQSCS